MSEGASALQRAAGELGLVLTAEQVLSLLAYRDMLHRWNRTYNLTAVREPGAMLQQHVVDCLAVLPSLARRFSDGGTLLDVGSGGGLPGVVVAIAAPAWRVVCVDAVAKKAAFVRQVAAELSLSNLVSLHGRAESLPPAHADVVASRAFATLAEFATLTQRHIAAGGVWMAMKGRHPQDEISDLPASVSVFHVEQLTVPMLDAHRCLVWMRPVAAASRQPGDQTAIPSTGT